MALVTGSLKDILGYNFTGRQGEIRFFPPEPGIRVTGVPGQIVPTAAVSATFGADGEFTADLANTSTFLTDMYYMMQIRWLDSGEGAPLSDFPDWQVRVTGAGNLSDMITFGTPAGGGKPNKSIWWVGLTAPPSHGYMWLHTNPDDPQDPANTGDVREWR